MIITGTSASPTDPNERHPSGLELTKVDPPPGVVIHNSAADMEALENLQHKIERWSADMERRHEIGTLIDLLGRKKTKEVFLGLTQRGIESERKWLATPPKPEEELTGSEAEKVVQLAKKRAKELGQAFPGPGDSFAFIHGDFFYTIGRDGRVTRRDKDVLTPEGWAHIQRKLKEHLEQAAAQQAEIAEIDRLIEAKRDEIGPMTDEETAMLTSGALPDWSPLSITV